VREELSRLEANVDHLTHDEIPPTDLTDELSQLDARLRVLLILLKESWSKRDRDGVFILINRLMKAWGQHNEYLRSAKAEAKSEGRI
jgi:hypothetical protein